MADTELLNIGYVIAGGLIGSSMITLFPYFQTKNALEQQKAAILSKPPEQRSPEENYIIEAKSQGFFEEYKFRFFFGLFSGIALVIAFLQSGLSSVVGMSAGQAIFAGLTASGFLTAVVDKIRASGGNVTLVQKPTGTKVVAS